MRICRRMIPTNIEYMYTKAPVAFTTLRISIFSGDALLFHISDKNHRKFHEVVIDAV